MITLDNENRLSDSNGPGGDKKKGFSSCLAVLFGLFVLAVLAVIIVPSFTRPGNRPQGMLTACMSNEKNIGTALEMYATDNNGDYPDDLAKLTPAYLKVIPTCPEAGTDTYSQTYRRSLDMKNFTFYCRGRNHRRASVPRDYPRYNSRSGLVRRP